MTGRTLRHPAFTEVRCPASKQVERANWLGRAASPSRNVGVKGRRL